MSIDFVNEWNEFDEDGNGTVHLFGGFMSTYEDEGRLYISVAIALFGFAVYFDF